MKKVGILGGTFDPVHNGHIYLAKTAKEKCDLQTVIFLPLNSPPHKSSPIADPKTRYDLLKKAIASIPEFTVSDMEICRSGTTYTVDTLSKLKKSHSDWNIYYIIGTDTLFDLEKWKDIDKVFDLCTFICMSRPIEVEQAQIRQAKELEKKYGKKILLIPTMGKNVSSTAIRNADENELKELIPPTIIKDVEKIYVKDNGTIEKRELLIKLKPLISPERYKHSISVEETAIMLAEIYGIDKERVSLAALLHDCAKNISKDPRAFAKEHNIEKHLHDYDDLPLSVLHAPMGAHLATQEFGVTDPEILSAITWHTSGKPDMSLMDKIIYLADYTEPLRPDTPALNEVRSLVKIDLDMALYKALGYSIEKIKAKGNSVHVNTLNAYNHIKNKMEERNG